MANFSLAGIFFVGLAVAIVIGLFRIYIIRRRVRDMEALWIHGDGPWTGTGAGAGRSGRRKKVVGPEPTMSEVLLDPQAQASDLPVALTHLPNQPSDPPRPSPRLLLSVLILQPQTIPLDPPILPAEERDLPEVAIGSRVVEIGNGAEGWTDVLSACADTANKHADEAAPIDPPPPPRVSGGLVV